MNRSPPGQTIRLRQYITSAQVKIAKSLGLKSHNNNVIQYSTGRKGVKSITSAEACPISYFNVYTKPAMSNLAGGSRQGQLEMTCPLPTTEVMSHWYYEIRRDRAAFRESEREREGAEREGGGERGVDAMLFPVIVWSTSQYYLI